MKDFTLSLAILLTVLQLAAQEPLVILHTNDTHSRIEYSINRQGDTIGGVICRADVINDIKKQHENVLLVDAGDFSQGSVYYSFFKGKTEIEIMNLLDYNICCLGNHEFDFGCKSLAKVLKKAKFPIVCSNYDFADRHLSKIVKDFYIMEVQGKKIGFFGLLTNIQYISSTYNKNMLSYHNAIETAQEMVYQLREVEHCDMVICLSHLGFDIGTKENPDDKLLAQNVKGIDIIIGGHSHTALQEAVIINNTYIVQAGNKGEYLGQIIVNF